MSYSCTISFKQIKPEEIYSFLQKLKEEATKVAPDIIKDEYIWSPIYKWMGFDEKKRALIKEEKFSNADDEDFVRIKRENEDWIIRCFTHRWYWDFEKGVLMLYSIPKQLQRLFDNTVYFQNSCERDYDFEEWSGIKYMEDIANKWKNISNEEMTKLYKESSYYDEYDTDKLIQKYLDYYRRTMCYDEIWNRIEWTLYNDEEITYITLFSKWNDCMVLKRCNIATVKGIKEDCMNEKDGEKMKALKYIPTDIEIEITDISLLTLKEAEKLPKSIREYYNYWWLQTPANDSIFAATVHDDGAVVNHSSFVYYNKNAVRPAITISNLKDLGVSVGDTITIQNKKYVVISDDKVLYDDEIVYHRFDGSTSDYEKSEIKKVVDEWLNES